MRHTNENNIGAVGESGKKKVLIFVVCYKAEKFIESVLDRIPAELWNSERFSTEVLVIDDQSPDRTFYAAQDYSRRHPECNITVLYNPKNQGYGGNQKIGYWYAIKKDFDVVVLLHGDGQYAPEYLEQMVEPILNDQADAVFGSRMIRRMQALKGRMPVYKWLGNQFLTFIQNRIMKSSLSEFHTGYRAYSVAALKTIPFDSNSNYFDFDTDIIIQLLDTQKRIKEIPIPTFYGDEISRVSGIKYAIRIIHSCILSRLNRIGLYYHPKFDYQSISSYPYRPKLGYPSSQQFALEQVSEGATVLDIGCGPGFIAQRLAAKNVKTISVDRQIQPQVRENSWKCIQADLEQYDFNDDLGKVDYIMLLDVIEHLKPPERLLRVLRQRFSKDAPSVIITTGNVAFFPVRMSLLFNSFNYGRRGILDMDHTRLFTFASLSRTLTINGYEITKKCGIPAPFPLALGDRRFARVLVWINRILIFISRSLFSYQIAVIARPLPTLENLLEDAYKAKEKRVNTSGAEGEQVK